MNNTHLLRATAIALLLAVSGCATTNTFERPPPESYELQIVDNVAAHRFDLTLVSHDRAICVANENWPETGRMPVANDKVTVTTGQATLPVDAAMFDVYCPGGCGQQRATPKKPLTGFISYEAVGNVAELAADPDKQLHFRVQPTYCR
ncbi:hypothetical protein FHW69_002560 [Luteibacter sp. Sphag1AF]|uniref:hypothetical protein n=1 Tax=Luteibacter sp. Sphag1AF TaxID=2587031 RepID=UPI001609BBAD|nr:hypothetical protein [Luteibacter sp. Sphag1AF]MBB3227928.1 hypothetical protein [Luteibacter sp. Sphag1AF]